MKAGKPLRRKTRLVAKTPLQAKTPLKSGGFLKRGSFIPRSAMKTKRPKVTAEERAARKMVRARSEGRCEGCSTPGPTDYSHRVGAGQGGPWVASNAMALCRRCHSWLHANPLQARRLGWYLRGTEDFRTIPVQHAWIGLVLLSDDGSTQRVTNEEAA